MICKKCFTHLSVWGGGGWVGWVKSEMFDFSKKHSFNSVPKEIKVCYLVILWDQIQHSNR